MILLFVENLSVWVSQLQPTKIGNSCDIYHGRTDVTPPMTRSKDLADVVTTFCFCISLECNLSTVVSSV